MKMIVYFLLVHFPVDGSSSTTTPEKPPRSLSQTKPTGKKSKSSGTKRKAGRGNGKNGESKWYLETSSSSANTVNHENTALSNLVTSTPVIDRPSRKLGKFKLMFFIQILLNFLILPASESSDELSKISVIDHSHLSN